MLTYALNRESNEPLYVQLYRCIRNDLITAKIKPGQKLPSKRSLAEHLGISVITVEGALAQLVTEGYLESRARSGFYACEMPVPDTASIHSATGTDEPMNANKLSMSRIASIPSIQNDDEMRSGHTMKYQSEGEVDACNETLADFTGASPATGSFPYAAWARTMRRVLSQVDESTLLSSTDNRGTCQLRSAIASHLRGFRGMDVQPEHVIVGSGAQSLYGLIVQLLGRDRLFSLEDPGYKRLAQIYRSHGASVCSVGMDEKGPLPQQLHDRDASVFHCMPSHQFPTGITTTVGRRRQLLEWATQVGSDNKSRYLIEDDYDCEFRMTGCPIPSLQSLDRDERVIYANTFTKTLGAAFRIGYMVLPPHLTQEFQHRLRFHTCTVGILEQLTLARFMESGEYERHVNRQRTRFRKILDAITKAISKETKRLAGCRVEMKNVGAGLHFILNVKVPHSIEAPGAAKITRSILEHALDQGVVLSSISSYDLEPTNPTRTKGHDDTCAASFVMNFASLEERNIPKAASVIAQAIQQSLVQHEM